MVKLSEDAATIPIADYCAAGQYNTQIARDSPIESIRIYFDMGTVTVGTANTEIASPFEGCEIRITYDDKSIVIPGRMLPALNDLFYPDERAGMEWESYRDHATAALTACKWDAWCRIPVRIPANPGQWAKIQVLAHGETYWSETAANTSIAASTLFFSPEYGSFDEAMEMSYEYRAAVAAITRIDCNKSGNRVVAQIVGAYPALTYTADATGSATYTYPANNNETDWLTNYQVNIGGETIRITDCPKAYQNGLATLYQGDTVGTNPSHAHYLAEYIIPIGVISNGSIITRVNANTAEILLLTVTSHVAVSDNAGAVPSSGVQAGGGGTTVGPPPGKAPTKGTVSRTGASYGGRPMR